MTLTSLGMSADQEQAHRYLLRRPRTDLATAADDPGLPDLRATFSRASYGPACWR